MSLLPKHIESMRPWLDLAQEVIAVDSHSNDGTKEFLEKELRHPNKRVLTHPPGLYQSWNFGIGQCRAKYIYISTVGETITRAGLEKLFAAAESLNADVVISPPRMVTVSGEAKNKTWPIHALIEDCRLTTPLLLAGAKAQLFAVANLRRGILGSSASNLYRAEILQRYPFRTDFGTAGDLAWGLEHAGATRIAVVPESFSTFVFHPKSYAKSDYAVADFGRKCLELARETVQQRAWPPSATSAEEESLMKEFLSAWEANLGTKEAVEAQKRSPWWRLKPSAWRALTERNRSLAHIEELRQRCGPFLCGQRSVADND
jgi:glycosyltransferase involved in cell wall biosynthesis